MSNIPSLQQGQASHLLSTEERTSLSEILYPRNDARFPALLRPMHGTTRLKAFDLLRYLSIQIVHASLNCPESLKDIEAYAEELTQEQIISTRQIGATDNASLVKDFVNELIKHPDTLAIARRIEAYLAKVFGGLHDER